MHDKDVACEAQVDVIVPSGMERLAGKVPTWQVEQRLSIQLPYNVYDKGVLWFKAEVCNGIFVPICMSSIEGVLFAD